MDSASHHPVRVLYHASLWLLLQVCPKDYLPSLLKYIDPENIPRYLGGTSDATLIDDAGPWNDPQIRAEIEEDMASRDAGGGSQTMGMHPEPSLGASPSRSTQLEAAQPLLGGTTTSFNRGSEATALPHMPPAHGVPAASASQRSSPFAAQAHHAPFEADSVQVCLPRCDNRDCCQVNRVGGVPLCAS